MSSLLLFNCEAFVSVVIRHIQVRDFHSKEFYRNLSLSPTGTYGLSGIILAAMLSNQGFRVDVNQPYHGWFDATLGGISIRTMLKKDQLQAMMHHCEGLIAKYLHAHSEEANKLLAMVSELRSSTPEMEVAFSIDPNHASAASKWVDAWLKQMSLGYTPSDVNVYDAGIPTDTTTGKRKLS